MTHVKESPSVYVAGRTNDGYTLIAANAVYADKILSEYDEDE